MNVKKKIIDSDDFILIDGWEVPCRVGTTPQERAYPQLLYLSVKIHLPLRSAGKTDALRHTIDYAKIIVDVGQLLEKRRFVLVEAVAETIASHILKNRMVTSAQVTVGKKIFSGVDLVGACITRSR
jgi:dihydroneopterin aldolase